MSSDTTKQAALQRQQTYTAVLRFLAVNPGATNDVLKKSVPTDSAVGLVAADVRKELGLRWQTQKGAAPGYRVDKSKYLKACVRHGIQPLALEDGKVLPNTTTVRVPTLPRVPAPAKRQRTTISQRTRGPAMIRFLAQNPGATSQQAMVVLGVKDFGLSTMARKELGLSWKKAGGVGGYLVDAAAYHAACEQYGIQPLPGVTEGAFFPSTFYEEVVVPETPDKPNRERARTLMSAKGTTRGTATSIATVPTSEVPPELLAATPRDLQPPVTTQGNDELAQLRGIIDLLRTEMAKRRIESVKVDPGGVTIRRTVVVEEPFV